jgi:hypothetical protein
MYDYLLFPLSLHTATRTLLLGLPQRMERSHNRKIFFHGEMVMDDATFTKKVRGLAGVEGRCKDCCHQQLNSLRLKRLHCPSVI